MTEVAGGLAGLAKLGKPVPAESELDRFAAYIESGAIITHASAFEVCAEKGDSERSYRPEGGLTEAVYRLAGNDDERAILARGVLEGELVRRGHEYRAVRATLGRYECDDLRDLMDDHSFGAVADALAEVILASAARSEWEGMGRSVPEAGLVIGGVVGTAPAYEGTVAAMLQRLDALEEAAGRSPTPTTAWEAMARSIARIADALAPPPPGVVDSVYVARRLGCTTTWIADQARNGDIPRRCIVAGTGRGKPWKFHRESIDEWIESR
ncbi:helix-turn-helix domain-containing protein [Paludisphaera borealis]|uniref:Helix-turn-helix domain-containing protein n=1 Tax=Paludisphaera borealis TaxID=1387353 RepID=A0A1U7CWQ9_9BACT|nr:helix-turn-helix domain-containing protein [Paludisphaera borealis]APW63374.1 hypothetical protein BSF38_04940 [Paludisphaera borealis]